jgi:hypothetical protein
MWLFIIFLWGDWYFGNCLNEIKMKRISIVIWITVAFVTACDQPEVPSQKDASQKTNISDSLHQIKQSDLTVLEIEGCEYFIFKDHQASNQGFGFMAHKGNCKNPIHCHNLPDTLREKIETSTED